VVNKHDSSGAIGTEDQVIAIVFPATTNTLEAHNLFGTPLNPAGSLVRFDHYSGSLDPRVVGFPSKGVGVLNCKLIHV